MKRAIVAAALVLSLAGCQTLYSPPQAVNPAAATSPQMAVQASINAGLVAIIALGETINADQDAGIMQADEAGEYRAKLRALKRDLDAAHDLLVGGDVSGAQSQAELIAKAVTALRIKIAQKARQA